MLKILAAAVLAAALAQNGAQQFSGTWDAALGGKTFARLELVESGGALSGRISLGGIHVDDKGVVDEVLGPAEHFTPIFDVRFRDGVVAFARKDGDDTDHFELRNAGADLELTLFATAEDRAALAREGVTLPKPVRLRKARP